MVGRGLWGQIVHGAAMPGAGGGVGAEDETGRAPHGRPGAWGVLLLWTLGVGSILACQAGCEGHPADPILRESSRAGVSRSSLRGIKEAIKIAGRCASRLGNFKGLLLI